MALTMDSEKLSVNERSVLRYLEPTQETRRARCAWHDQIPKSDRLWSARAHIRQVDCVRARCEQWFALVHRYQASRGLHVSIDFGCIVNLTRGDGSLVCLLCIEPKSRLLTPAGRFCFRCARGTSRHWRDPSGWKSINLKITGLTL